MNKPEQSPHILALDPGSSYLGWCRSNGTCGTFCFKSYDDHAAGLCAFKDWLSQECKAGIDCLAIERPGFHMRAANADFVHGLIWAAHETAHRLKVRRIEARADTIRKTLLGRARKQKGESTKVFDAILCQAVKKFGFSPKNEHETDAAALVVWAMGRLHHE